MYEAPRSTGVWASSPNDAWFVEVGTSGTHWNGNAFVPEPGLLGSTIWGDGSNDVWSVGPNGLVVHHF